MTPTDPAGTPGSSITHHYATQIDVESVSSAHVYDNQVNLFPDIFHRIPQIQDMYNASALQQQDATQLLRSMELLGAMIKSIELGLAQLQRNFDTIQQSLDHLVSLPREA